MYTNKKVWKSVWNNFIHYKEVDFLAHLSFLITCSGLPVNFSHPVVTWLKYCRNGVKLYPINKSIYSKFLGWRDFSSGRIRNRVQNCIIIKFLVQTQNVLLNCIHTLFGRYFGTLVTQFLGYLCNSGDLLLWVGVCRRASCVYIFFSRTTWPILTKYGM